MSQTLNEEKRATFERIESFERLITLRATSPDAFMLQTSEATRYALIYYERAKAQAERRKEGL